MSVHVRVRVVLEVAGHGSPIRLRRNERTAANKGIPTDATKRRRSAYAQKNDPITARLHAQILPCPPQNFSDSKSTTTNRLRFLRPWERRAYIAVFRDRDVRAIDNRDSIGWRLAIFAGVISCSSRPIPEVPRALNISFGGDRGFAALDHRL